MQFLVLFAVVLVLYVVCDLLMQHFVFRPWVARLDGTPLRTPLWWAQGGAYVLTTLALSFFALFPAFTGRSVWYVLLLTCFFMFFVQGAHALTLIAEHRVRVLPALSTALFRLVLALSASLAAYGIAVLIW